jgi:tellurite resistance protein TerC
MSEPLFFVIFLTGIIGILLFDLLVIGKKQHIVTFREAIIWSSVWISLALGFFFFLGWRAEMIHGISDYDSLAAYLKEYFPDLSIEGLTYGEGLRIYRKALSFSFLSGYLIEETLSLDNLFVILMILTSFQVPLSLYKKILFWGILGAVVLRFLFIFLGAALIHRFEWTLYLFGLFLLYTGIMLMVKGDKQIAGKDRRNHFLIRYAKRIFPVTDSFDSGRFFLRIDRRLWITPLFLVLILVEFTDVLFAMDSIPAIFGVTRDPFIVFYSNIFAIIGLRSLFFLLANLRDKFRFLKTGIAVLLCFIGLKLLMEHWFTQAGFRPVHSLYVIATVIGLSILFSFLFPGKKQETESEG